MNTVRVALHMLNTRHFRKWEYMDCFTYAHLKLRLLMDEILHHFNNQVGEQSPRTPQLLILRDLVSRASVVRSGARLNAVVVQYCTTS